MIIDTSANRNGPSSPEPGKEEVPRTGGFASLLPEDADYAVEVCREQDSLVSCRVPLRLEPEHGPAPKRPQRRL